MNKKILKDVCHHKKGGDCEEDPLHDLDYGFDEDKYNNNIRKRESQ